MVAEFTLGIGTNLVTDLIKYGGKRFLDTTVIGTKLKEKVGLLDTTTEDEFKKLLLETYVAYFSKYPDRQFQVFYDFFDSKHVIECLYNFVFNFQPIDYLKLENALKTEMGNDWILMRILEKQNLTIRDMIINFIDCYLKSEKDSTGIGFLTAIREIRQSEERILNKTSSQLDNASQKIIESV